jgi:hypothetical protein
VGKIDAMSCVCVGRWIFHLLRKIKGEKVNDRMGFKTLLQTW